jgi:hypothetical protein
MNGEWAIPSLSRGIPPLSDLDDRGECDPERRECLIPRGEWPAEGLWVDEQRGECLAESFSDHPMNGE